MCADTTAETPDYKDTLNLPKTDFPMRAGLPKREPDWLARWEKIGVYDRLREKEGRTPFTLHDGPPYANGNLHIGHALNKTIKDIIVRSHQMLGHDSRYVPGWDCHGLPIEWKIEQQYREKGKDKDEVDVVEFRQECRRFAEHWIDVQREEFKRLGVTGNWDDPYLTMDFHAERVIAEEFMNLPDERLALPGLQARDVVAGGEDRAGRGGGGVPRPPDGRGVGAVSGCVGTGEPRQRRA
jgi:isoleucyl-tRNA synthetase